MSTLAPPWALLAELTHRCPLRCAYCSNPVALVRATEELDSATWMRVLREAADMGVLHVHFSGGEPTIRRDLEALVAHAKDVGLYTNLITSGAALAPSRVARLAQAGLDHVQLSVQHADAARADAIGKRAGAHREKLEVARAVRDAGLPLTLNAVLHRASVDAVPGLVGIARTLDAHRIELAHAQLYGWAQRNRDALVPSLEQVVRVRRQVEELRAAHEGRLVIEYVPPDHLARRPKACMGGWGRRFVVVTPSGRVLPCHAAESIPGLSIPSVAGRDGEASSLASIWRDSPAFARFRGTAWMKAPCRDCDRREIDFGGCRCQALAVAGDAEAVDPACERSELHARFRSLGELGADGSTLVPVERALRRSAREGGS